MTKKLLVTGMVRSGTSLISRALDAHPQIVCALDPCLGFFRSLRNELLSRNGGYPDPEAPFEDFFFGPPGALGIYLQADLHLPLAFEPMELTKERLRYFNRNSNCSLLVPEIDRLGGEKTFAQLFEAILGLLQEVYGSAESCRIGFVQTWVEALAPGLINTWPDLVCVHILRDPRAVIASWLQTTDLTHDYPLLMMLRHWRKSAILAGWLSRKFAGNYLVTRYEDFVQDPAGVLGAICRRLGLVFDPDMTQTAKFRSGGGARWQSNTSYEAQESISAALVEKWRERLSADDLQYIEDMCAPEMALWNYPRVTPTGAPGSLLKIPAICRQVQGETDWIGNYADAYAPNPINRAKELFRWYLCNHPEAAGTLTFSGLESVLIAPDLLAAGTVDQEK